jgi:hypothetical protein
LFLTGVDADEVRAATEYVNTINVDDSLMSRPESRNTVQSSRDNFEGKRATVDSRVVTPLERRQSPKTVQSKDPVNPFGIDPQNPLSVAESHTHQPPAHHHKSLKESESQSHHFHADVRRMTHMQDNHAHHSMHYSSDSAFVESLSGDPIPISKNTCLHYFGEEARVQFFVQYR